MLKVDKSVPLPFGVKANSVKVVYPFRDMGVNDSFFISVKSREGKQKVYDAAWQYGKRHSSKFVSRVRKPWNDQGEGVRVWRIL